MGRLLLSLCLCLSMSVVIKAKTREYYIAAVEIDWNYAPLGNVVNASQSDYDTFLKPSAEPPRIGHVYKKALLREYTDKTFTTMKERPPWMGILGPIIRAEVNDLVIVHFFNNATVNNFSLHPHGVLYEKNSEGALYLDGTNGTDKADDAVPPGSHHTYFWHIDPRYGPTDSDSFCLTWAYHSHRYAERDINTGLVGALIICKPGILSNVNGGTKGVDQEYVLFYHVMDENLSWYIERNFAKTGTNASLQEVLEDMDFMESNMMHSINGYLYGNLNGVNACVGDTISWHLLSLGNEMDIHGVKFQGQSMIKRDRRSNFASLFPAKFVTVRSKAQFAGNWTINCEVYDHLKAGMQAFFNVKNCGKNDDLGILVKDRSIRQYNIAAEEIVWDYAPSGLNKVTGKPLQTDEWASQQFSKDNGHIGGQYIKAVYRQYDDDKFTIPSARESYLGILGPVIGGEVGDVIKIVFFNNASRPYSLLLNGFAIQLNATGIKELGIESNISDKTGHIVKPGETYTYFWLITTEASLTSLDEDCISSYYSSYVDISDYYAGLLGVILICKKGVITPNKVQSNVDKQMFLLMTNFNENESPYLEENIRRFSNNASAVNQEDSDFMQSNIMYSINGMMYDNLEGLHVCLGDHVIWHVFAVGTESDMHVLNFEDLALNYENSHRDMIDLIPGVSRTFTMVVDSLGVKDVICTTNTHYAGGMRTKLHVENCPSKSPKPLIPEKSSGTVRTYYIAAVEEEWDYAPNETHPIFGKSLLEVEQSRIFIHRDATHIGKKYKKALFREFTDDTFTTRKPRTEEYLGMLGPIIKGEVGDTIIVKFKNLASRKYNIRAHGVLQTVKDTGIPPNVSTEYKMIILERSGPGKDDLNCITWAYVSAVDPTMDVNTGLVGPLIACRPGTLQSNGNRKDVKKEFPLLFSVSDENKSWYLDDNIQTYCLTPNEVNKDDEDFQESNKMHGINGYVYGNLKGLSVEENEPAAIYLIGFGDEMDIHTVHFHGETFVSKYGQKKRGDVTEVFPGTFETIQLQPANPGTWLLHCHINDHMEAGMMTTFTVSPAKHAPGSSSHITAKRSTLWSLTMNLALSSLLTGR